MKPCLCCGKEVDWEEVKKTFSGFFNQVNTLGTETLTETQLSTLGGNVCSQECFDKLD